MSSVVGWRDGKRRGREPLGSKAPAYGDLARSDIVSHLGDCRQARTHKEGMGGHRIEFNLVAKGAGGKGALGQ